MTGLVLSGGGIWSTGAIGVLAALKELGVRPGIVVGSSAGALIGALYAAGVEPEAIAQMAGRMRRGWVRVPWARLAWDLVGRWRLPGSLLDGERLWAEVDSVLGARGFDDTICPLWVTATDLIHRCLVVWGPDDAPFAVEEARALGIERAANPVSLATAVRASTAVPGLFAPVRMGDAVLVDGGVADDYPVDVATLAGADRLIGVWIDEPTEWRPQGTHMSAAMVLYESLAVMIQQLSRLRQRARPALARVDIRIPITVAAADVRAIPDLIADGYLRAMARASELTSLAA
jgi:NTE family protein